MKHCILISILVCLLCSSNVGFASEPRLFEGFSENAKDSFSGRNLLLHGATFLSTALLVRSGVDGQVYDHFRRDRHPLATPGAIAGSGVGAAIAAIWLYRSGELDALRGAYLIAQTSAITLGSVAFLKITTGRAHPTNSWHLTPQEQSEEFQFGFLRNGPTAYGWPSGHVAHTVAVTTALAIYYDEKPWLTWFAVGASAYMLYTVTAYDAGQMHWFSDGVAGALMGYAIGSSVGKNFRARRDPYIAAETDQATWLPIVSSDFVGAFVTFEFE